MLGRKWGFSISFSLLFLHKKGNTYTAIYLLKCVICLSVSFLQLEVKGGETGGITLGPHQKKFLSPRALTTPASPGWWPRWRRVLLCSLSVLVVGALYNVPRFFELSLKKSSEEDSLQLAPTKLRLDALYVLFYVNLGSLAVTGLLPFAALAVFNAGICR